MAIECVSIFGVEDIDHSYIVTNALRLLGVSFNSLGNLDGMPFYLLHYSYLDRLPQLLIAILQASPIGLHFLQYDIAIPVYTDTDILSTWSITFLCNWHTYLMQLGLTFTDVGGFYSSINRHTREFIHFAISNQHMSPVNGVNLFFILLYRLTNLFTSFISNSCFANKLTVLGI